MTVAVGADHRGYALKEHLKRWLAAHGHRLLDCGCDGPDRADYPDYAYRVARTVARGRAARGLLVCSTGIGMSIAANRLPRVRAALCQNVRLARLSRQHNNSNVLCLGADFVTPDAARRILAAWLDEKFAGGRHARRVRMLGSVSC